MYCVNIKQKNLDKVDDSSEKRRRNEKSNSGTSIDEYSIYIALGTVNSSIANDLKCDGGRNDSIEEVMEGWSWGLINVPKYDTRGLYIYRTVFNYHDLSTMIL